MANNCPCPPGTVPDESGNNCISTVSIAPTVSGTVYPVVQGNQSTAYGQLGAYFYADITSLPWPIAENLSGSYHLEDNGGTTVPIVNTVNNAVWGSMGSPTSGRLNVAGVWTNAPGGAPFNEWIGFSACVNITTSGTYCIGLAADNECRIKVNGNIVAELTSGSTRTFNIWHVFPITLSAGTNIIELEGLNSGSIAAFGAEIYQATVAQLSAVATPADLAPYIVFSTQNMIGQNFQTGEVSGYSCPDGYALDTCSGPPSCVLQVISPKQCCFKLTNCVNKQVIYSSNDLSQYIGQVISLSGQYAGCWSVETGSNCTVTVDVIPVASFDTCSECLPCYVLTNCDDDTQTLATNTDLSAYVGDVIQIDGTTTCWQVTSGSNCARTSPVEFNKSYGDCLDCKKKCYKLVNCADGSIKITDEDLSAYVGQVVQIKDCKGQCWQVELSDTCTGYVSTEVTEAFATCDLCNPPPAPVIPPLLNPRKVYPGYDTKGCSVDYTERTNCKFAEEVFKVVKKARYGITVCCGNELEKWWIKKQLLDLRMIYDPDACNPCLHVEECPCPEVVVPIPVPVSCPNVTDVTAIIVLADCDDATDVDAEIIFNVPSTLKGH